MKILALVLAGGEGTRLHPLTARHAKPALPFADGYRIIDFVLSNLVNSGIFSIYVLAQYKPHSLIEHLAAAWASYFDGKDHFLTVILPGTENGAGPFRGTADAVHQNLHLIERHRPDVVGVFAADHVYRMDVRQMADFHSERNADVSVAAVPVPVEYASSFGVMVIGQDGEIHEFQEKPERPVTIPADPTRVYASMGNYLFNPRVLIDLIEEANRRGGSDFGLHIVPGLPGRYRAFAYDFSNNFVPGVTPYEERGYWRDVGTVEALVAVQKDILGPRPRFNLYNHKWPILGGGYRPRTVKDNATAEGWRNG
ncbi:MAG: NTP transferase domain-containing protein [Burkholderiales bacterium]|nr:NTP transferase domain-containing protein [Burkholderiales bacterium]